MGCGEGQYFDHNELCKQVTNSCCRTYIDLCPVSGEGPGDPGGGGPPGPLTSSSTVRETIFSSEICSVEYQESDGGTTRGHGTGTILLDDIGNNNVSYHCYYFVYPLAFFVP